MDFLTSNFKSLSWNHNHNHGSGEREKGCEGEVGFRVVRVRVCSFFPGFFFF